MPRFLVPRNTGTHRVAAIALYRALLASCSSVPVAAEERESLRNVVRNKFRRNQLVHSSRLLTLAFSSGYDTLDMFDRSVKGDTTSTTHICELLEQTPLHLKRPPRIPKLPKQPEGRIPTACPPPEQQLLNTRPYMTVPGRRKIPILRVNNGVPFLMYSKPQPESLGRILRYQALKGQDRQNWLGVIENDMMPQARQEDFWDDLLEAAFGIGDSNNPDAHMGQCEVDEEDSTWVTEVADFQTLLYAEWKGSKAARSRTARLMQGIVDREEVLAEKEEKERESLKRLKQDLKARHYINLIEEDQF
ncbi:hypothetical protein IWX90DRAFT_433109 [Phyllosticta citrichinensis]|uniref:Complex 1 LYR protein domain-containing protein n=1 Tax=Phyllosticta citrichinensis TaxID=1130410 RepID=A0ABR1XTA8_9PEZI